MMTICSLHYSQNHQCVPPSISEWFGLMANRMRYLFQTFIFHLNTAIIQP